ncbi:NACHT domain-containing protein [Massilia aerilata]|uniref:NACHT domain-containing protein n=1 Tax=Massilia aerilata TaxID=453817 RepID=A0ABW0RQ44_9BURK
MNTSVDSTPPSPPKIHDRRVRRIEAGAEQPEPVSRFSDHHEHPRLIVLGDPGAGKTSLFTEFMARDESAHLLQAVDFLSDPDIDITPDATLYIDGLDENRKHADPRKTIRALFKAINALKPAKVRIACRAVDWHSSFGLDKPGGLNGYAEYRLLALQPLDEGEQMALLQEKRVAEPHAFINKAKAHGLQELLENPLSLVLLVKAVAGEQWPAGRHALFDVAIDKLLTEHNSSVYLVGIEYFAEQLRGTAGALCALRLLSDVAGISVNHPGSDRTPFYGNSGLWEPAKAQAALGRLVFASTDARGSMDASHKSIAEFLAAEWLAGQVVKGLPLSRVRALICIRGLPPTPLRGIHAWLAVLLDKARPDEAAELIAADPVGVLAYADASLLRLANKQRLLSELAQPANANEKSDRHLWSNLNIGTLSCEGMVPAFHKTMAHGSAEPRLLSLTLKAVAHGEPRPELMDALLAVLFDPVMRHELRYDSLHALLRLPVIPFDELNAGYGTLGSTETGLRLRGKILPFLYGQHRSRADVLSLLSDLMEPQKGIVLNRAPYVSLVIPHKDLTALLDEFVDAAARKPKGLRTLQSPPILWTIDHLVAEALVCCPSAERLRAWLRARHRFVLEWRLAPESDSVLLSRLINTTGLCDRLADLIVGELAEGQAGWDAVTELMAISAGAVTADLMSARIGRALAAAGGRPRGELEAAASRLAAPIAPDAGAALPRPADPPRAVTDTGDRTASLWRERLALQVGRLESLPLAELECKELWKAGRIFYGIDSTSPDSASGIERLRRHLGEDRALEICAGLISYAARADVLPEREVLRMAQDGVTSDACYAVSAGLALSEAADCPPLRPELVGARLMADCMTRQDLYQSGKSSGATRAWADRIGRDHPQLAVETNAQLVTACGGQGALAAYAAEALVYMTGHQQAVLTLLRQFPTLPDSAGLELMEVLVYLEDRNMVRQLVGDVLARTPENIDSTAYRSWLAFGIALDPETHFALFDSYVDRPGLGAALAWLMRFSHIMGPAVERMEAFHLAGLVRLMYARFKFELAKGSPDVNLSWVHYCIGIFLRALEQRSGPDATNALNDMHADPDLAGLKNILEPVLKQQLRAAIDSQDHQHDWKRVERSLRNGPPADQQELQDLVMDYMKSVQARIDGSPMNIHKWFWNEGPHGSVYSPKPEESCRDVLMGLLEPMLADSIDMAPEEAMPADQRTDIAFTCKKGKVVVELKRDSHDDLWTAIMSQLDRYTKHEKVNGYGIYGVFWFGADGMRGPTTPRLMAPPKPEPLPDTPEALLKALYKQIPEHAIDRLKVFVIDVSAMHHAAEIGGVSKRKKSGKSATAV